MPTDFVLFIIMVILSIIGIVTSILSEDLSTGLWAFSALIWVSLWYFK